MNFFLTRYKRYGHDLDPNFKPRPSLRINTLRANQKDLLKRLKKKGVILHKVPFTKNGYYYEADFSVGATAEYLLGYYYLQEPASQTISELLDPKETDVVLDMCAAPGSKTTHLSQLMNNKGTLIALDSNLKRIDALKNNLERMGSANVITIRKDAEFADDLEMDFDKILLDAPCSGNYTQDEDWFEVRVMEGIENNARIQKKLLGTAAHMLKENGTLIYSTCSLEPEENEEVVEFALENLPLKLERINLAIGQPGLTEKTKLCKRFWPDTEKTQGFFVAKFRKE